MTRPDRIFVLIPCYRCEKQIPRVLMQLDVSMAPWVKEVAVIDNCSPDASREAAIKTMKSMSSFAAKHNITFTVLKNNQNFGLGGSHKSGFAYALEKKYTHVIIIHGDDQADMRELIPLLKKGLHHQYHALLGGRFMPGSVLGSGYGWFRRTGNAVFNLLFSALGGKRTWDMGSGLNLYRADLLAAGDHLFAADNLTFHCYYLLRMFDNQRHLHYFPITWREEDQVSNAKLFKQSWEIFKILLHFRFSRAKFLSGWYGAHKPSHYSAGIVFQTPSQSQKRKPQ